MKQKICGLLAMLLLLSGCGSSTPTDTSPMSEDEITQMYSDPDSFKGRTLELYGRVFNEPEYDDDGVYFQMWGDPENGERNTIVACKDTSLKLQDDDYVHISGSVSGKHEGENALGSKITAPAIVADSVEVVTYQEACAPTLYTATVQTEAQTQCGYTVSVDSVELAEKETRVAVTVTNNGAAAFSIYDSSAKIVQNGKQFEREYNSYADYPELQSDLMVGASTTGIITFPVLEKADFDITLTGSSDDWDESIAPFTFYCTFGDAAAQTQQELAAEQAAPTYMLYDGTATKSIDLSLTDTVIGSNKLWPTDTKTITTDDLSKLTQNEVAAVRNEIYARHGYTFTTDEWKIFFVSAEWYHADSAYSNNMLNATEKANVDTILNYEKSAGGQQEKTRPEDMASQAALNYCQTTGWTNSRVNFVESRPAGGYYVNVMKIDDSDNSYEENYVVTVENGKAIVTGTEQFGEFTPID